MMDTNSLAKMRIELQRHSNPNIIDSVGVNEILDVNPKLFMNPDPGKSGIPGTGGIRKNDGSLLPVGGAPQGQQFPQQAQPQQPPMPPNQPVPQPPSNILNMTRQGQEMNAMTPPQGLAKGGQPKSVGEMRAEIAAKPKEKKESKRILVNAQGPGGVKGIVVPRHMLYGSQKSGKKGMIEINKMRAKVYGEEPRKPLTLGQINRIHKDTLDRHFQLPLKEQKAAEAIALGKLRDAGHIGKKSNTLDESEKLDTVRHEYDNAGRTYVGHAAKGIAGHALYWSGTGDKETAHVLNTCPGQTEGCGGGIDENGIANTQNGTCFAPNAESQYVNAAVRRACHAQAKHDPAMTADWILAHAGSLRKVTTAADKKNQVVLFRPNVVDESDTTSRHLIRHLNRQRSEQNLPNIVSNSYGKTGELHDPDNGIFVTHSNVGPKTKKGKSIVENIGRDKRRVRETIYGIDGTGKDLVNEDNKITPPKNSYMVSDVKRGSPMDHAMQNAFTHIKYWSVGRDKNDLSEGEKNHKPEAHYDGNGNLTDSANSHYGHMTVNGRRYDYQKQHILHPRLVQVGNNDDGSPHMIPTDSRFKDDEFLPPDHQRFKTRNGKNAGAILLTTPTESTSNVGHDTSFTHHVNENHIKHAMMNNGEFVVDDPHEQEATRNKEYKKSFIKVNQYARGGSVNQGDVEGSQDDVEGSQDDIESCFPEIDGRAQAHNIHRMGEDEHKELHDYLHSKMHSHKAVKVHTDIHEIRREMAQHHKAK
jgi:hypothetical protein